MPGSNAPRPAVAKYRKVPTSMSGMESVTISPKCAPSDPASGKPSGSRQESFPLHPVHLVSILVVRPGGDRELWQLDDFGPQSVGSGVEF